MSTEDLVDHRWYPQTRQLKCKAGAISSRVVWVTKRYKGSRGTWVAQSVKPLTLAQVMTSCESQALVSSSPASGSVLTAQSLGPASSLPLSLCPYSHSHSVSLSKINRNIKKKKKKRIAENQSAFNSGGPLAPELSPPALRPLASAAHWPNKARMARA